MPDELKYDPVRFPHGTTDWADSYVDVQPMPDGRAWCLVPLIGGRLRIMIAEDQFTAGEHWCYDNKFAAVLSYHAGPWVEPTGWSRHMHPDGRLEYPGE
jgi:hypothetical protein